MARKPIKINTNCVADRYSGPNEKIIEFSSPGGGGLIDFALTANGELNVLIYQHDATVKVIEGTKSA